MSSATNSGWAVWVVGLPGSGKSTLAKGIHDHYAAAGMDVLLLEMDKRRKKYIPNPTYSQSEREKAYELFVDETAELVNKGKGVVMDGSAYKATMRRYARENIGRFAEIFVQCDLKEAMRREAERPEGEVMADLYRKSLIRKETGKDFEGLGEVIGVDVDFEKDPEAELTIDNTSLSPEKTLRRALHFLDNWLPGA